MIFSVVFYFAVQAQDNVVLKNGDTLCVRVVKDNEKTIVYQYSEEILLNVREIRKVVYENETIKEDIKPVVTLTIDSVL